MKVQDVKFNRKNQTQSTIIIGIEFNKIQGEVEAGDRTGNLKVYFFRIINNYIINFQYNS